MNRDSRPLGQHLGDLLLVDHRRGGDRTSLADRLVHLFAYGSLLVTQLGGRLEVVGFDGVLLLQPDVGELYVQLLDLGKRGHAVQLLPAPGLVHQVDRLVWQEAIGHVPVGKVDRGNDRLVGEDHLMEVLVPVLQSHEDLDRIGDTRLVHLDRLEAAGQR